MRMEQDALADNSEELGVGDNALAKKTPSSKTENQGSFRRKLSQLFHKRHQHMEPCQKASESGTNTNKPSALLKLFGGSKTERMLSSTSSSSQEADMKKHDDDGLPAAATTSISTLKRPSTCHGPAAAPPQTNASAAPNATPKQEVHAVSSPLPPLAPQLGRHSSHAGVSGVKVTSWHRSRSSVDIQGMHGVNPQRALDMEVDKAIPFKHALASGGVLIRHSAVPSSTSASYMFHRSSVDMGMASRGPFSTPVHTGMTHEMAQGVPGSSWVMSTPLCRLGGGSVLHSHNCTPVKRSLTTTSIHAITANANVPFAVCSFSRCSSSRCMTALGSTDVMADSGTGVGSANLAGKTMSRVSSTGTLSGMRVSATGSGRCTPRRGDLAVPRMATCSNQDHGGGAFDASMI